MLPVYVCVCRLDAAVNFGGNIFNRGDVACVCVFFYMHHPVHWKWCVHYRAAHNLDFTLRPGNDRSTDPVGWMRTLAMNRSLRVLFGPDAFLHTVLYALLQRRDIAQERRACVRSWTDQPARTFLCTEKSPLFTIYW